MNRRPRRTTSKGATIGEDASIWRYMDLSKFVSRLDRTSLFFARADLLGDKFEDCYDRSDLFNEGRMRKQLRLTCPRMSEEELAFHFSQPCRPPATEAQDHLRRLDSQVRARSGYVSCWHRNDYESVAMWKVYLKSDEGIAVRSTAGRLTRSLRDEPERTIHVGPCVMRTSSGRSWD
jgi:hypothetical protein